MRIRGPLVAVAGPGRNGITLLGELIEDGGAITPAQLSLIGDESFQLPADINDATIELTPGLVVLRSGQREWRASCSTWQLHRDVGARFYAAIPPRPTPWKRRLGWRVLLGIAATAPGRWLLSRRSRAR